MLKLFKYDQLSKICRKEKILIIEDGCHSFGTKINKNSIVGNSKIHYVQHSLFIQLKI